MKLYTLSILPVLAVAAIVGIPRITSGNDAAPVPTGATTQVGEFTRIPDTDTTVLNPGTTYGKFITFDLKQLAPKNPGTGLTSLHATVTTTEAGLYSFNCSAWTRMPSGAPGLVNDDPFNLSTVLPVGVTTINLPFPATKTVYNTVVCSATFQNGTDLINNLVSDKPTYQLAPAGWENDQMLGAPEMLYAQKNEGKTYYAADYILSDTQTN